MNCEESKLLVGVLHDNNLEPHSKIQVEKHLLTCATCKNAFEQERELSRLLQKSFIHVPSAELDKKILQEFRLESERRRSQKTNWWQTLFAGSISIPKPAFAAAVVVIAVVFGLSILIERSTSNFSDVGDVKTSLPSPGALSPPARSDETDKTKIVEVPIIRDRIVKQIVYVERRNPDNQAKKGQYATLMWDKSDPGGKLQTSSQIFRPSFPGIKVSDSIAENGYFTQTNLSAFQPVSEMKTRIIKEAKINEK